MGPLTLADFIGLDVCLAILEVMHDGLGDPKYRPCPLLRKMVQAGYLGRKTGRGFYYYQPKESARWISICPKSRLEFKTDGPRFCGQTHLSPTPWRSTSMKTTPADLIKECAELGYFGFTVPEEYGGLGMSATAFMGVLEEICAACAGFGIMLSVHNSLTCEILKLVRVRRAEAEIPPAMASRREDRCVLYHRAECRHRCRLDDDDGGRQGGYYSSTARRRL